jgi:hypothetical protein
VQSELDTMFFLELLLDAKIRRHTNRLTQEESNRCVYDEVDESRGQGPAIGVVYGTEERRRGGKEEEHRRVGKRD